MTKSLEISRMFFNAMDRMATRFIMQFWWLGLICVLIFFAYDVWMLIRFVEWLAC